MQHEECRAAAPPNRRSCVVQPREAAEGPKALVVAGRASRQARYLSSGRPKQWGLPVVSFPERTLHLGKVSENFQTAIPSEPTGNT